MELEGVVEIKGKEYQVIKGFRDSNWVRARVRDNQIIITMPRSLKSEDAFHRFMEIKNKMIKRLERASGAPPEKSEVIFTEGQTVNLFGRNFMITMEERLELSTSKALLIGNSVKIITAEGLSNAKKAEHISRLARRVISAAVMPVLTERVTALNNQYFNSKIGRVMLKDNLSNWGSCSKANNINLDFRLLFAPHEILDAIIAHELSHTKHRNHSKDFYGTLLGVVPDYKSRMRWLKKNGHMLGPQYGKLDYLPQTVK